MLTIVIICAVFLIGMLLIMLIKSRIDLGLLKGFIDNMATTDPLTCINNRRYIDENIDRLLKSVSRSNGMFSLMMIDIDFFKKYNEVYGHSKGDNCLKMIANLITLSLKRGNDIIARYGGEEFVLLLPNTDEDGAHIIADRLIKNINESKITHANSDIADYVTVSIGVSTGGGNFKKTGDDYIKRAEEALAISKENGRNRYTLLDIGVPN
jgi:diguanylate cyclase (GGDEF)-like protein